MESFLKFYKKINQIQWSLLTAGVIITLLVAVTYVFKPAYFKLLENKLYDVFLLNSHSKYKKTDVAIVDIDEYSLENFGQWPWPRYRVALLLKKIQMAGALAVGNDILFGEPDGTSPSVIKKTLKRDLKIDVEFKGLPPELMDNDQLFSNVLGTGPFALGYSFYFKGDDINARQAPGLPRLKISEVRQAGAAGAMTYMISAAHVIPPLPAFLKQCPQAGFMNTLTDNDGVLRRVPLMIAWQGNIYPHLSLATLLTALKGRIPDPMVKISRGGLESLKIGETVVPLEAGGSMLINYKGPSHTFPYLSAGHVLEDKIPAGFLENKIVFLGSSAAGLMDIRVSPLDEVFPGVEVNATIVDNILNQDFITIPDWIPGMELFLIFFWGIVTTFLIGWADARLMLPVMLMLAAGAWYTSLWFLKTHQIWVSPFFPILGLAANFSILNLFKFWFSERKKKFYRSAFSKYVSKAVVDQISESPEKMSLEGEEKDLSIMFADIRSFTSLSEKLTPTQVTMLLHDYFTPVTKSIIKNHGTLDKFIGDAVMCFWNAPLDVKNHQKLAVKTGFEMLDSLVLLNQTFKDKYGIEIDIGIGIHSGKCRVGNMGSADLFDYTIIGDNVNLTSRLEGLTKFYGVKLIISQVIITCLPDTLLYQELDQVQVKGKTEPVAIYTVFQPEPDQRQDLETELTAHRQGLIIYKERQFHRAKTLFQELCLRYPHRKIYSIYLSRCEFFIQTPPEDGWDGVFVHTTK